MTEETQPIAFSSWFKERLRELGMSGCELAQRMNIQKSRIYHYLSGFRIPDAKGQRLVAEALGIPVETMPVFEVRTHGRPEKLP